MGCHHGYTRPNCLGSYVRGVDAVGVHRQPDEAERQEHLLAGEGMSTRAIAPIVGASDHTVRQDIKAGARNLAPAPTPADEFDGSDWIAPHPQEEARNAVARAFAKKDEPAPAKVTGLDGKSYPKPAKPETRMPNRRALPDQFFDATGPGSGRTLPGTTATARGSSSTGSSPAAHPEADDAAGDEREPDDQDRLDQRQAEADRLADHGCCSMSS